MLLFATLECRYAAFGRKGKGFDVLNLNQFVQYMSTAFLGGPRWIKLAWVVNAQKGGTLAIYLAMIWAYGATGPAVWVLVALHGSYGLIWLMKDAAFPDANWQKRVTFGAVIVSFLAVLGPYWIIGWVLFSGRAEGLQSLPALALATGIFALGVALMIAADAQKFYTLRLRPGLIEDGMFARIRHPNYLGEMLIYGSFALVVWHWLPVVILSVVWSTYFASNIAAKERSLARHPGWAAYKARTGLILPKLSGFRL